MQIRGWVLSGESPSRRGLKFKMFLNLKAPREYTTHTHTRTHLHSLALRGEIKILIIPFEYLKFSTEMIKKVGKKKLITNFSRAVFEKYFFFSYVSVSYFIVRPNEQFSNNI